MKYTPRFELDSRVARLQAAMVAADVDCVLVRQNVNLYYFAGTIQNSHLFIPAEGQPLLMTRRDFMRARLESALDEVVPLRSLREIPAMLRERGIAIRGTLGLEFDALPTSFYLTYADLFAGTRLANASNLINQIRSVKSDWEVERIEDAARQADLMYRTVRDGLREGVTEIELAAEAEKAARISGHQGLIRMRSWNTECVFGYLSAGLNSALPAHLDAAAGGAGTSPALGQSASYRRIRKGEVVYVDLSGCADGYIADQTRNLVIGPPPAFLRDGYEAMRDIYVRLKDMVLPGVRASEVFAEAVRLAKAAGYEEHFMGSGPTKLAFVGHGVGLELDELPPLARGVGTTLEAGMVLTLEPKVTIPGVGSIGMENTHLLTAEGLRALTFSEEELAIV